ncbi:hypothetical protein GGR90_003743 [Sphingopyxis italica]|uniref:DNA mimic protein DMP19 C-terminal domain-containing protein n=1 Tax=Sphingopyxis italica TaxID=1129133 RepID=A0A7X6BAX1_9SPHN|nr:hypothetical protein [Sphingopyxis italica]
MVEGRIETFIVSPSEANEPEHQSLCLWIGCYVDYALGESQGGYKTEELPPYAGHFYDLWTYHGEYKNGGHAQYAGNIPDPAAWARASQLLDHMGLFQYQQLLDDFIAFATLNEDMIEELTRSGQELEAIRSFYPFDDRFDALEKESGALHSHLHDWLLQQPWLTVDPALEPLTFNRLKQRVPPHPEQAKRYAANIRRRTAEMHGETIASFLRLRERFGRWGSR